MKALCWIGIHCWRRVRVWSDEDAACFKDHCTRCYLTREFHIGKSEGDSQS